MRSCSVHIPFIGEIVNDSNNHLFLARCDENGAYISDFGRQMIVFFLFSENEELCNTYTISQLSL